MTNTKKGLMESETKEFAERISINQQKHSSELVQKPRKFRGFSEDSPASLKP
jgi:hypothetical protein